jgi:hypothetical protein
MTSRSPVRERSILEAARQRPRGLREEEAPRRCPGTGPRGADGGGSESLEDHRRTARELRVLVAGAHRRHEMGQRSGFPGRSGGASRRSSAVARRGQLHRETGGRVLVVRLGPRSACSRLAAQATISGRRPSAAWRAWSCARAPEHRHDRERGEAHADRLVGVEEHAEGLAQTRPGSLRRRSTRATAPRPRGPPARSSVLHDPSRGRDGLARGEASQRAAGGLADLRLTVAQHRDERLARGAIADDRERGDRLQLELVVPPFEAAMSAAPRASREA